MSNDLIDKVHGRAILKKAAARGGKYYKRVPKPGGGYRYYYSKKDYDKAMGDSAHVHGSDTKKERETKRAEAEDESSQNPMAGKMSVGGFSTALETARQRVLRIFQDTRNHVSTTAAQAERSAQFAGNPGDDDAVFGVTTEAHENQVGGFNPEELQLGTEGVLQDADRAQLGGMGLQPATQEWAYLEDDSEDLSEVFQRSQVGRVASLGSSLQKGAQTPQNTVSDRCPQHGSNAALMGDGFNPHTPCTCSKN